VMGMQVAIDFWEEGPFIDIVAGMQGVRLHMIKLTAPDDSMIELLKYETHPTQMSDDNQPNNLGIRHIAFTVADVDAAWKTLKENGCQPLSDPISDPNGKARLFYTRDPEGNWLEIVQIFSTGEPDDD
jgi:catechol 2,3-dioxygenase-like lactoylglutathione lyase family enzyme